jgi:hypothetical protein
MTPDSIPGFVEEMQIHVTLLDGGGGGVAIKIYQWFW